MFPQLILKCNLCKYTVLHKIICTLQFLVEILRYIAVIVFLVFLIVSNIVSYIMHQEIIKQCRRIQKQQCMVLATDDEWLLVRVHLLATLFLDVPRL